MRSTLRRRFASAELNVQNQQKIEWPRKLVVAKAYVDQLERSQGLAADQIAAIRQAVQSAESSQLNQSTREKLNSLASSVETSAGTAKSAADASRLHGLGRSFERSGALIQRQLTVGAALRGPPVSLTLITSHVYQPQSNSIPTSSRHHRKTTAQTDTDHP